jgi:hypothetical protein
MDKNNKIHIKEATSDSGGRGSYISPLQPSIRIFKKSQMGPFTEPVSKYKSPSLEFDSYDGKMSTPKKDIKKIEKKAEKSSNYMKKHPNLFVSDEDGNNINQTPGKGKKIVPIEENTTSKASGEYRGPIELGLKKWRKSELTPFDIKVDSLHNKKSEGRNMKNNIKRVVGIWEKGVDGTYNIDTHPVHTLNEWIMITEDTTINDIMSHQDRLSSNYEKVVDNFKKRIPEEYHKNLIFILDKIKDYIQDRGFVIKVLNSCSTGFRGVRTKDAVIICSPDTINNLAVFIYVLFHELKHEIQMSEFGLESSYMGDIEDFEKFYNIYWEMEMDADRYAKTWVQKIGDVLKLPEEYYKLDPMIDNYPMMSNSVKSMMVGLHSQVQKLKKEGMTYEDISDLDVVKKHLDKLEDMF